MTKRHQIYKCEKCGQIVQVLNKGAHPVCCGEKMHYMEEDTVEASLEKHIPVVEKIEGGYRVFVGTIEHPMTAEHYIEWIQLITDKESYTKFLAPGEKPEAFFKTEATNITARAYCNLHGNWKKEL